MGKTRENPIGDQPPKRGQGVLRCQAKEGEPPKPSPPQAP